MLKKASTQPDCQENNKIVLHRHKASAIAHYTRRRHEQLHLSTTASSLSICRSNSSSSRCSATCRRRGRICQPSLSTLRAAELASTPSAESSCTNPSLLRRGVDTRPQWWQQEYSGPGEVCENATNKQKKTHHIIMEYRFVHQPQDKKKRKTKAKKGCFAVISLPRHNTATSHRPPKSSADQANSSIGHKKRHYI